MARGGVRSPQCLWTMRRLEIDPHGVWRCSGVTQLLPAGPLTKRDREHAASPGPEVSLQRDREELNSSAGASQSGSDAAAKASVGTDYCFLWDPHRVQDVPRAQTTAANVDFLINLCSLGTSPG